MAVLGRTEFHRNKSLCFASIIWSLGTTLKLTYLTYSSWLFLKPEEILNTVCINDTVLCMYILLNLNLFNRLHMMIVSIKHLLLSKSSNFFYRLNAAVFTGSTFNCSCTIEEKSSLTLCFRLISSNLYVCWCWFSFI